MCKHFICSPKTQCAGKQRAEVAVHPTGHKSRARWQYTGIETRAIKLGLWQFLMDKQETVHSKSLLLSRTGSGQFTILDTYLFSWGFWQCLCYLPIRKWHFESDEQRHSGQCHCFCEAGKPVLLICLPPGNDEKLMAQQKSCFTRVNWSKKPFPSIPTSIWPHFVHKVRKRGYLEDLILQVVAGIAEYNIESKFPVYYSITVSTPTIPRIQWKAIFK